MNKLLIPVKNNIFLIIISGAILLCSGCRSVSFTTTIEKENETKDGIYLEGYVVELNRNQILELDGKKVKVCGKYYIVKAINNSEMQGREVDTKHIRRPKIKIIN